jgi:RNA polymerase sigma-70 factor (ECF subfamily)
MLVAAARRGDGAALDRLYRRFAPVVHGILLGYAQHADAEDLTQQVFETAIAQLDALRDAAAFPGWIASAARRAGLDARRRNAPMTGLRIEAASNDASPEDRADAERVLQAIRMLPGAYRETLVLRLVEGLSGPEIAELTGLTPGSVRVNLHRGMAQLRQALDVDARGTGP